MNTPAAHRRPTRAPAICAAVGVSLLAALAGLPACATNGGQSAANEVPAAPSPVAAAELREKAIAYLLREAESELPERRANAIEALLPVPRRVKPAIERGLSDQNLGVRAVAAMAAARIGAVDLAPGVRPLLRDPSPLVRVSAVYALHAISRLPGGMDAAGGSADPSPLGRYLFDPSPRVRSQAAFALGELGDRSALPMLREAARDPMGRAASDETRLMRLQLAEARAKLGDDEAVQEIRAALYPSRPEELEGTALAAQVLGQIGDRGAIAQLVYLTARTDGSGRLMPGEVRLAAAASLAKLGLPRGHFIAEDYRRDQLATLRAQAAYVLGQTGQPGHLTTLSEMMGDPDGLVRLSAAAAILQITDRLGAIPSGG